MKTLNYTKNFNNKLDCRYYTSIRPASCGLVPAEKVTATIDRVPVHEAVAVEIRHLKFDKLNNFTTCLDAGVELHIFKGFWKEWYPDFDFENDGVFVILFRVSSTIAPSQSFEGRRSDTQISTPQVPTNEKIALFCRYFERYNKVKYKISKAESGMIQKVEVTEDLLERYFLCRDWWASVKSVTNYVKNINQVRVLASTSSATTAQGVTTLHPNQWDKEYSRKLDGPGLTSYFKHLRSLGLEAKKGPTGLILDWVPSAPLGLTDKR